MAGSRLDPDSITFIVNPASSADRNLLSASSVAFDPIRAKVSAEMTEPQSNWRYTEVRSGVLVLSARIGVFKLAKEYPVGGVNDAVTVAFSPMLSKKAKRRSFVGTGSRSLLVSVYFDPTPPIYLDPNPPIYSDSTLPIYLDPTPPARLGAWRFLLHI